jgi:hypothetical protein
MNRLIMESLGVEAHKSGQQKAPFPTNKRIAGSLCGYANVFWLKWYHIHDG